MTEYQILTTIVGPAVTATLVSLAWEWVKRRQVSPAEQRLHEMKIEGERSLAEFRQKLESDADSHKLKREAESAQRESDRAAAFEALKAQIEIQAHQSKTEIEAAAVRSSAREQATRALLDNLRAAVHAARRLASPGANESDDVLLRSTADALPNIAAFVEAAEHGGAFMYLDEDEKALCIDCRKDLLTVFLALDFDLANSNDPAKTVEYLSKLRHARDALDTSYDRFGTLIQTKWTTRPNNPLEPTRRR